MLPIRSPVVLPRRVDDGGGTPGGTRPGSAGSNGPTTTTAGTTMSAMKGLVLAGSLLLAVHGQEAQWQALCLQPRDVPVGFHQTVSRPLTNRDLITTARFPPEVLAQIGRIGGYQTEFRRTPYRPEL